MSGGQGPDWQDRVGTLQKDKFGFHPVLGHADMVEIAVLPGLRDTVRFVPELAQFVVRDENRIWDSSPAAQRTANTLVAMWIMHVIKLLTLKGQSRATMLSQEYKRGVLSCLAEQEVIIRPLAEWDTCPWEMQTPGGVVDLRWGCKPRPTELTDFNLNCTRVTPVLGPMPVFDDMRAISFENDAHNEAYLRQQLAASLFGDNSDHAIRWIIGASGSGKSSLLGSVHDCLGSYAGICASALIASTKDGQLNAMQQGGELQVLARVRFAVSDEVQTNAHIHGLMVKQITNNDQVRIQVKYKQTYTAPVRANVWVTANTMPSRIEGGGEGLARRMKIVSMNGVPAPDQYARDLRDKLKDEHPQILAWLMEAAHSWFQSDGDDVSAPPGSSMLVEGLTASTKFVEHWWHERWQFDVSKKDDPAHRVHAADLWKDFAQVWWPTQDEAKARHALGLPMAEIEFYRQLREQIVRIAAKGDEGVWNDQMQIEGGKRRSGYYGVSKK
jgi:P4 family phage/plasmid primase-like protien